MTKKHFEEIAAALRIARERGVYSPGDYFDALNAISSMMATICSESNPNFDRHRFLEACGAEE